MCTGLSVDEVALLGRKVAIAGKIDRIDRKPRDAMQQARKWDLVIELRCVNAAVETVRRASCRTAGLEHCE